MILEVEIHVLLLIVSCGSRPPSGARRQRRAPAHETRECRETCKLALMWVFGVEVVVVTH